MKTQINFKFLGYEEKQSSKGNTYCNISILQGADMEKLYFPFSSVDCALQKIEPLTDCKGTLEIKKDRYGIHLTLTSFEEVK